MAPGHRGRLLSRQGAAPVGGQGRHRRELRSHPPDQSRLIWPALHKECNAAMSAEARSLRASQEAVIRGVVSGSVSTITLRNAKLGKHPMHQVIAIDTLTEPGRKQMISIQIISLKPCRIRLADEAASTWFGDPRVLIHQDRIVHPSAQRYWLSKRRLWTTSAQQAQDQNGRL